MSYDPNKLRHKRTIKALQEALLNLMSHQSFESIKTVDICKEAMVHRTTFYLHFENKDHLLEECVLEVKQKLEAQIPINETTCIPSGYYVEFLRKMVVFLDEHPKLERAS